MGFIKFIFILVIVLPVAVFMLYLFKKLVREYNEAIKKEREAKRAENRRRQSRNDWNKGRYQ